MTLRVHYHVPVSFVGGAERQLQYLIKYLKKAMPEFTATVTYEHAAVAPFIKELGVSAAYVRDRKALLTALATFNPDILQFYTSPMVPQAISLMRKRPKVIEVIHNKNQFPGDATTYSKDFTSAAVCVSPDAQTFISGYFPNLDAVVIPNGVDTEKFTPDEAMRSKTPVFGFAGRLCPDKGVRSLIKLAETTMYSIELVGQNFMGSEISDLPKSISVFPHTDAPEDYYRRWWGFLSASPHESFGLAIAEAMACNTPPIMLDCGGITHYMQDGRDGFICSSISEMAGRMQMVAEGRARGLKPGALNFTAEAMADGYREVYEQVLRSRPRPAAQVTPVQKIVDAPKAAKIFKPLESRPKIQGGALGVTPRGWYGVVRSLAGVCDWYAPPSEALDAIKRYRPKVVVLGCFQNEWLPICRAAKAIGAKVVATWHASYILNEFDSVNRKWMAELLDAYKAKQVDFLATPHEGLAQSWTHFGYHTNYMPNLIETDLPEVRKLPGINIGILGSGQTWKNMECQIVAAAMVRDAKIHVQEVRDAAVLDRLGIQVEVHSKGLTDDEYYALLGGMTVNMCVSLSEVYSYLTAESFLLKTPVLTSSITPVLRGGQSAELYLEDWCGTPFFEDPEKLADDLDQLIAHASSSSLCEDLRIHMIAVNAENQRVVEQLITKGWGCELQS